jgi:hypothetical protein
MLTAALGFLLCIAISFLMSWVFALVAIFVPAALYKYVEWRDHSFNWGRCGRESCAHI